MSRIFISYRRQDSPAAVGRIFDHLENHFGRDSIFKDVNALKIGDDFRERLNAEVEQCQILLAVIGRNWLNAKGSDGRRRLENPADWVRLEIQTALNRNVPVIPILLDGVEMPAVADMPKDLHPLAYRHAARVRNDPDFRRDIEHVMRGLDRILAELPLPKTAAELTYNSHREPSFPRADLFSVIDVAGEFSEQSSVLPVLDTLASAPSTESDAEVSSNDFPSIDSSSVEAPNTVASLDEIVSDVPLEPLVDDEISPVLADSLLVGEAASESYESSVVPVSASDSVEGTLNEYDAVISQPEGCIREDGTIDLDLLKLDIDCSEDDAPRTRGDLMIDDRVADDQAVTVAETPDIEAKFAIDAAYLADLTLGDLTVDDDVVEMPPLAQPESLPYVPPTMDLVVETHFDLQEPSFRVAEETDLAVVLPDMRKTDVGESDLDGNVTQQNQPMWVLLLRLLVRFLLIRR